MFSSIVKKNNFAQKYKIEAFNENDFVKFLIKKANPLGIGFF
jgi:hypothetical protein